MDNFYVADWVNFVVDVNYVLVFKNPDYVGNGVNFTDVGQKFISQTFALRGAFYQPGNVIEFDGGIYNLFELESSASGFSRSSGTFTTPTFGSMVVKG